ncbi:ribonuclease H-like domain-containing protein [Tanacetum coccineum]
MTPTQPPSYQFLDDNLDTSLIALHLLTTPTSPQQTPPRTIPQTKPQATPVTLLPTPSPLNITLPPNTSPPKTSPPPPPPPPPPSTSQHPMVTRFKVGIVKANPKYNFHVTTSSPIPKTPVDTEKKLGPEGSPVTDPTLYRSLAGALQYLTFTRPDLSYAVQQLCLYMHDPREPHLNAMKRVLRYLRGTTNLGLQLFRSTTSQLIAYSDADWAGCPATRRSTSGYCVFLGDNLLTWSSKRQDTLSRSSAEAEYRGVANAVAETSWIRNLLRELHTPLFTATLVYCDNVSAVYMSANPVQHQRTKHIEIDIHFVRDKVAAGHVRVLHVPSRFQYADIFTKGLPYPLFTDFRSSLSVRKSPAPTAGAY